jgi:nitric oxide synthase oxygenase domain/subunit
MFRSDRGIWRYEVERNGRLYWSSLHTRDEKKARTKYERMKAAYEAAEQAWSKGTD